MKLVPRQPLETADISAGRASPWHHGRVALALLGVAALVWWLLGIAGAYVGAHLPDRWERQLEGASAWAVAGGETGQLARAQAVLARLREGEPLRDLDYRLFQVDMDKANAVAIPGGAIGVTPALLEAVASEEGLAFVLAHELGHHQRRHMTRRLGRSLLQMLLLSVVLGQSDIGISAQSMAQLAESGYSRADEREADDFAMRLVYRKYGGTEAALEFFRHVLAEEGDPVWQKFLGTHPGTAERLAAMEALQRKLDGEMKERQ